MFIAALFTEKEKSKIPISLNKYKTFIFSCLSKIPVIKVSEKLQSYMSLKNNTLENYGTMGRTL